MITSLKTWERLYRVAKFPFRCRSYSKDTKNPFTRTWGVLSKEVPEFLGINKKEVVFPEHADIVIIGGGFIGTAVAYWLKVKAGEGLAVVVLENDPMFKSAQKNLSLGTITQHFALPENILLAQYGAEFLRNFSQHLNKKVDLQYCPHGHLVLASEQYAERLEHNIQIQREYGVKNELLTVEDIKMRFPYLNTEDISIGCIGRECEGTFNAWMLLKSLIKKSVDLGAIYINAEVIGFELELQRDLLVEGVKPGTFKRIKRVLYKTPDNEEYGIKFAGCVLAAGDKCGEIARLAKIGTGEGLLGIPLPIEGREEKVYSLEDNGTMSSLSTPMISDTSGLWLQKNGLQDKLLCGHIPLLTADVKESDGDEYYEKIVKPALINRVPNFKDTKGST
ncbi:FAD-dependent oxidoreductase domain-containing protein 1-like isoform X2 [Hyposmocoma kahamanoa]|uniref:FAD-dependent oxidoreductase domain-containing protein 1-like isoform X2 n=1 Tax=Hyposmocoma kahamanoa TaxID=1477025 RepID=UPI000E6D614F|nr:FAD-dependent oxidoreductase domain-containing protein 1-like isoform X2 [Hyposmocoma kahamanoa]